MVLSDGAMNRPNRRVFIGNSLSSRLFDSVGHESGHTSKSVVYGRLQGLGIDTRLCWYFEIFWEHYRQSI